MAHEIREEQPKYDTEKTEKTTGIALLQKTDDTFIWHSFYRRAFLIDHGIRFNEAQRMGEDVLFNIEIDLCNPSIEKVTWPIYRYNVNTGSTVANRSAAHCRQLVDDYQQLLSRINALATSKGEEVGMASRLKEIGQRQLVPMTSRILSSNISIKEFQQIRKRLLANGFLPLPQRGKLNIALSIIYRSPYLLKVYQWLFRNVFQTVILPRLSRN